MSSTMFVLALVSASPAHPFGERFGAVSTTVSVDADGVDVTIVADVPRALLDAITRQPNDPDRFLELLPTTVRLEVDGSPVPLDVRSADHAPDLVFGHAEVFTVVLRGEHDMRGTHQTRIQHGALATTPVWLRSRAVVPAGAWVLDHELAPSPGDGDDLRDQWTRHARARRWAVRTQVLDDPLDRWIRTAAPPRWAKGAEPVDLATAWHTGRIERGPVLLTGLVAAGLGLGAAPHKDVLGPHVLALGLGLVAGPHVPPVWTPVLVAIGGTSALLPDARARGLATLLCAAWSTSILPGSLAIGSGAAFTLAALLAPTKATKALRVGRFVLVASAVVAVLRGSV